MCSCLFQIQSKQISPQQTLSPRWSCCTSSNYHPPSPAVKSAQWTRQDRTWVKNLHLYVSSQLTAPPQVLFLSCQCQSTLERLPRGTREPFWQAQNGSDGFAAQTKVWVWAPQTARAQTASPRLRCPFFCMSQCAEDPQVLMIFFAFCRLFFSPSFCSLFLQQLKRLNKISTKIYYTSTKHWSATCTD